MPSSRNSGPSTSKPKRSYHARSGVWASSTTRRSGQTAARCPATGRRVPGRGHRGASTTRPIRHSSTVVEHPRVADHRRPSSLSSTCRVPVLQVAAVEVGVGALLLDHEHVLPQPPDVVRRPRRRGRRRARRTIRHREELQRLPPRPPSLGDERQQREDVDQVGHLDVGQLPTGLGGTAGEQPAARHQRVPGAAEHQRRRQPGEVAQRRADLVAGRDPRPSRPTTRRRPRACRGTATGRPPTRRSVSGVLVVRSTQGECSSRWVGCGRAPVPQRLREGQGVAAAGGVAAQHQPARLRQPSGPPGRSSSRTSRATCAPARAGSPAARSGRARAVASRATYRTWKGSIGAMKPPPCTKSTVRTGST